MKTVLSESIKIPNLHRLSNLELQDKMIEIVEKVSKQNQIPVSALEEVFNNQEKKLHLFSLLRSDKNNEQTEENKNVKKNVKTRR